MTDATEERRPTGEQETTPQNGRVLLCYLRKWGLIAGAIVVTFSAGTAIRSCVEAGAGIFGLQTTKEAKEVDKKNEETHRRLWKSIGEIKKESKDAADYSRRTYDALPNKWKGK